MRCGGNRAQPGRRQGDNDNRRITQRVTIQTEP